MNIFAGPDFQTTDNPGTKANKNFTAVYSSAIKKSLFTPTPSQKDFSHLEFSFSQAF